MLLILFRHGTAEDKVPDEIRELTGEGQQEVRATARALKRFGIRPRVVLSSHRIRAIQTAEQVIDEMEITAKVEKNEAIDHDRSWREFHAFVSERLRGEKDNLVVLCAGHQPQFGRLATMALQGTDEGMDLKKGSALGIRFKGRFEAGEGRMEFYLTPKFASLLGK